MVDEGFTIDANPDVEMRKKLSKKPAKGKAGTSDQTKGKLLAQRERALASLVFGDDDPFAGGEGDNKEMRTNALGGGEADDDDELVPDEGSEGNSEEEEDKGVEEEGSDEGEAAAETRKAPEHAAPKPAWEDDEDAVAPIDVAAGPSRLRKLRKSEEEQQLAGAEYEARLREQFRAMQRGDVSWAAVGDRKSKRRKRPDAADQDEEDEDEDEDEDEEAARMRLLRSAAPLERMSRALPEKELSVKRATDLNHAESSSAVVQAMEWHPNGQLALTAGFDKTLRLFRVDGLENPKLQSVHIRKLPLASAVFSTDGSQVLLCGPGRDWAQFDLEAGRVQMLPGVLGRNEAGFRRLLPSPDGSVVAMITESGALLLLSAKSKQIVCTLQSASARKFGCQSIAFSPDSSALFATGDSNLLNVWDVRRRCCVHAWRDRGGVRCTTVAVSPDGQLIACGADSGSVNLYETAAALGSKEPESVKEFLNLTTSITSLKFNPASEMLCFASKYKKGSMRVAHVPGRHVFSNWPTSKTPLGYVQCCAFSPMGGYIAFGNDKGKALLYRVSHYATA